MTQTYLLTSMDSPLGQLHLLARGQELVGISFHAPTRFDKGCTVKEDPHGLPHIKQALEAYFSGQNKTFDFAIDLEGVSPFTRKVLMAIKAIPYGETRTYGQIAAQVGSPQAFRAVGTACGKNPIVILIGCHRVLASSGIGGFSAGLWRKKALLKLEKAST